MPVHIALALMFALASSTAEAADFAAYATGPSRLGAIFAAPGPSPIAVVNEMPLVLPIIPSRTVPGYYGRAGDFSYRNYYGTSPVAIFSRLPYACGFHGYC